jgi:hypothetical protein
LVTFITILLYFVRFCILDGLVYSEGHILMPLQYTV